MSGFPLPITMVGLLSAWQGLAIPFGHGVAAGSTTRLFLRRTDSATAAQLDGTIDTSQGSLGFSIPANTAELDVAFSLAFVDSDIFEITLTAPAEGMNLTGYLDGGPAQAAAAGTQLTTLANVKAWLNITGTAQDGFLDFLIDGVSRKMQAWMRRPIVETVRTGEWVDSNGLSPDLNLGDFPIVSVEAAELEGVALDPSAYQVLSASGALRRLNGDGKVRVWPQGLNVLRVDYTSGYSVVPEDIRDAATMQTVHTYNQSVPSGNARLGIKGTVLGDAGDSQFWQGAQFLPAVYETMRPYRKVNV